MNKNNQRPLELLALVIISRGGRSRLISAFVLRLARVRCGGGGGEDLGGVGDWGGVGDLGSVATDLLRDLLREREFSQLKWDLLREWDGDLLREWLLREWEELLLRDEDLLRELVLWREWDENLPRELSTTSDKFVEDISERKSSTTPS